MKLIESKTLYNLAKAFALECQARTRYEFIEFGARNEGYKAVAEVVDRIVFNEFNHARMFYTKIQDAEIPQVNELEICGKFPFKEKWDLTENLKIASEDESAEIKLYPKFSAIAKEEGFLEISQLFTDIAKVEKEHFRTFTSLYKQMAGGTLYKKERETVWKCPHCGFTVAGTEAPKTCPVCQEKQGSFSIKF